MGGLLGLAGRGIGLLGNPYVQGALGLTYLGSKFNPISTQDALLKQGPDDITKKYRSGPIIEAYRFLDSLDGKPGVGIGSKVSQVGLENAQGRLDRKAITKDDVTDLYYNAVRLNQKGYLKGDPEPLPNESPSAYKRRLNSKVIAATRDENFKENPVLVEGRGRSQRDENRLDAGQDFSRTMLKLDADRAFRTETNRLQERIDSRVDANDLLRMQLAQSDSQFARQLAFDEKRDSRERRDSIAAAIAALGGAIFT